MHTSRFFANSNAPIFVLLFYFLGEIFPLSARLFNKVGGRHTFQSGISIITLQCDLVFFAELFESFSEKVPAQSVRQGE